MSKTLNAVISDPNCDYVDVCLMDLTLYYEVVMKVLEADKHVFGEIPQTVTLNEAREMTLAAEAKPELFNSVNFVYRRIPSAIYARKFV